MNASDHIDDLLEDLLDGELDEAAKARAEEHLEHCARCRSEWAALRDLAADLRALPQSIDPPHDLWRDIEGRLDESQAEHVEQVGIPTEWSERIDIRAERPERIGTQAERPDRIGTQTERPEQIGTRTEQSDRIGTQAARPDRIGVRIRRPGRIVMRVGLVAVVLAAAAVWLLARGGGGGWSVEVLDGSPLIAQERVGDEALLRTGQWLETDEASRARLRVGSIGEVAVEPNTRLQLRRSELNDHRIALAEGRIDARIWAPPRLFFVETPAATAIDLGCAYTLDVDSTGRSVLHVTAGYVELERDGKSSIVPAGAMCYASPDAGPGTVFSEDASTALRSALERYDFEGADDEDLDIILSEARPEDAMTLWQLVERSDGVRRARIYRRLVDLVPPPSGVTEAGILDGDDEMFEMWRLHLGLDAIGWWGYLREKMAFPD